jgi:cysteine desulfurase
MPVYLDCHVAAPLDPRVRAAMLPDITKHRENPSSLYCLGRSMRAAIGKARQAAG